MSTRGQPRRETRSPRQLEISVALYVIPAFDVAIIAMGAEPLMTRDHRLLTAFLCYVWAAPSPANGLALSVLALRTERVAVFGDVIEAHGQLLRSILTRLEPRPGIAAITRWHVVLGRDARALRQTRSHEPIRLGQYGRRGPFSLPAYAAGSLWALARGGNAYLNNWLEREARHRRDP